MISSTSIGLRNAIQKFTVAAKSSRGNLRRRGLSDKAHLYPDRSQAHTRPDFSQAGPALEKGENGVMEALAGATILITCAAFMYLPHVKSEQTLKQWARVEALKRLEMKENDEPIEYGVWYSEQGAIWNSPSKEED